MSSPLAFIPLVIPNIDGYSVLDVGCGRGKWGYLLRADWWLTDKGERDTEPDYLVGLDLFLPFLQKVKFHRVYDDVLRCHASYLPFSSESFDVVLASEIIEHMPKEDGDRLLSEIERVSKNTTIVTTPHISFRKRGGLPTPEGFNPYENHVQRWTISDLVGRGYKIRGAGLGPFIYHRLLNSVLSPLAYFIPQIGSHIVAKKSKRNGTPAKLAGRLSKWGSLRL